MVINYIRHISLLSIKDKFRFTNEIVNKGNSLTVATNKKGEIVFCSENITDNFRIFSRRKLWDLVFGNLPKTQNLLVKNTMKIMLNEKYIYSKIKM